MLLLTLIIILNLYNYIHATYAGECLSGLVVQGVEPNGGVVDDSVGSIPSATYTTEGQIAGFHGIAGENCIKRLGVYTQMDSNELRGKHD